MAGDIETPNTNKLVTKTPPPFPTSAALYNLNKSVKGFRFIEDSEGFVYAIPAIIIDPRENSTRPLYIAGIAPIGVDAELDPPIGLYAYSANMIYKPVTGLSEQQRTPDTFKTMATATAGSVEIWSPTAGTRFRLMGGVITLSKEAACAGAFYVTLQDEGASFMRFTVSAAALVATGNVVVIPIILPGNGYLSTAINNDLDIFLNGALTAGEIAVSVWGTEE